MKRKKILIFEPNLKGHVSFYLVSITRILLDMGYELVICFPKDQKNYPSINKINEEFIQSGRKVSLIELSNVMGIVGRHHFFIRYFRQFYFWKLLKKWFKQVKEDTQPDIVFILNAEQCLYGFCILGTPFEGTKWMCIMYNPKFPQKLEIDAPPLSKFEWAKEWLFYKFLKDKSLHAVFTTNLPFFNYMKDKSNKFELISDPVPLLTNILEKSVAKQKLNIDTNRKLILIYGSISFRKGLIQLCNALSMPEFPNIVDVLVAGKFEKECSEFINKVSIQEKIHKKRLIIYDRFIDEDEEAVLFSASDIIWTGYIRHYGPSGVLIQAYHAKTPVIASKWGQVGKTTNKYNLGISVEVNDPIEVIEAVKILINKEFKVSKDVDGFSEEDFPDLGKVLKAKIDSI